MFSQIRKCDDLSHNLSTIVSKTIKKQKLFSHMIDDVRKTFSSGSHESLLRAYRKIGLPSKLIDLLKRIYRGNMTRFRVYKLSRLIVLKQGVVRRRPGISHNVQLCDVL